MIETEIYFLIGQSVIYLVNCGISIYLLARFNRNITEKLDKLNRITEPVQEPDTARVDRGTAVQLNAYYDAQRGVYEMTPKS